MNQSNNIAEKIWNIFAASKPALRLKYRENPNITDRLPIFSTFITEHSERAGNYVKKYTALAAAEVEEKNGLQKVLDAFTADLGLENPDLLYYALEVFLTKHKGDVKYMIPSIFVTDPVMVLPSPPKGNPDDPQSFVAWGDPKETKMDWFREDPSLNEHHAHWHVVYDRETKLDRQGEMFFYMHQQMLARYDADRISSGVPRVRPFDNMQEQLISVGYLAGDDARLTELEGFSDRPPIRSVDEGRAEQQVKQLQQIHDDISNRYYKPGHPQKPEEEIKVVNRLGSTIEYNNQEDRTRPYRNYHGNGHVAIAELNNGVMYYTFAAIRDVAFWEWHKGVDDIYFRLQETFEPTDFSRNDPKVTLRKMVRSNNEPYSADLILCHTKDIPGDPETTGNLAFGGSNWEKDFEEGSFPAGAQSIKTVKTLHTYMKKASITYNADGNNTTYDFPYLTHDPFTYYIRVENKEISSRLLTVRIFLAPTENMEDRRSWIELDKFTTTVDGNSKKVICRKDELASVVKKPADADPDPNDTDFNPINLPLDAERCSCGWPYRMLLPRGIEDGGGMDFTLMVMITDGTIDGLGVERNCGSVSFCAANATAYPDKLPLGFPFNRKFAGNGTGVRQFLTGNKNVISRSIRIKHHQQS